MTPDELKEFARIKKRLHYGLTYKELVWLVKLVEKLEKRKP